MSGPDTAVEAASADATVDFLRNILPETGLYCASRLAGTHFTNTPCATLEELAQHILAYDAQGVAAYHGCSSLHEAGVPRTDGRPGKQFRVQRNVRSLRSFYFDLDCGPGKAYESQDAAMDATLKFLQQSGLPDPIFVSSGNGLHLYFSLTSSIGPDAWKQSAEALKMLAAKLDFKADPAVTADSVRVLRTIGTWNRKDPAKPLPVELIADAPAIDYSEFNRIITGALAELGIKPPEVIKNRASAQDKLNEQFAIKKDFPPFSAVTMAKHCQQLARMRDTKGHISEPAWYASICLLVHSTDGSELIHAWSNGYAGYSREETDRKFAQAKVNSTGPTLCSTFESRNPGGCDNCPFKGKISSPAQLGAALEVIPTTNDAAPVRVPSISNQNELKAIVGFGSQGPVPPDPITQSLEELNQEYAWVRKQKQIFRFFHQDFITPAEFKIELATRPPIQYMVGKSLKTEPLSDRWIKWPGRRNHLDIVYEPGQEPIFNNQINLWPGWGCKPSEGEIEPWRRLLDEAFGRESFERSWFEQWVAYPIQHPGAKLFTAVMLWGSAQGLGKSLIGQTIGKIYGRNYREIDNDAIDKTFNSWVKGKQFILGEELTSGDRRSVMNKLKHLITGETISLDEKFQPEIVLRNTINFMFTSNNPDALHIALNDRRMCIIEFAGNKLPKEFFDNYLAWRDARGGLNALMHHLLHLPRADFSPTAEAPRTRAKEEMMDATFSDIERWLYERLIDPEVVPPTEVVYAPDLAAQFLGQKGKYVTDTAVGLALASLGSRAKKRVKLPDARKQLHAIRRHQHWAAADEGAWADEYMKGRTVEARIATATEHLAPATVPRLRHS